MGGGRIEEPALNKYEESELVDVLSTVTDRSKKDIQSSFTGLERRDVLRIMDLCKNYSKIERYSKLVSDASGLQEFKTALEKDVGKNLSSHQIQRAANSVR